MWTRLFSVEIAQMVGKTGHVIAADLQAGMLRKVKKKIQGTELEKRITLHKCEKNKIGVSEKVDFILLFYMVFIVIESISLRPAYPLIVTGASLLVYLGLILTSVGHPEVVWSGAPTNALHSKVFNLWQVVHVMIFLSIAGISLTWLTRSVRKTILQAVELEAERFQFMREQANLLLESKIGALGELVAGISHEINNPLGVVKANTGTGTRALRKIRNAFQTETTKGDENRKTQAILDTMEQLSRGTLEATRRIESTLDILRNFARLDETEFRQVNIHESLDNVLALIPQEKMAIFKLSNNTEIYRKSRPMRDA